MNKAEENVWCRSSDLTIPSIESHCNPKIHAKLDISQTTKCVYKNIKESEGVPSQLYTGYSVCCIFIDKGETILK